MKTEFLKHFDKDLDKIQGQIVKDNISKTIKDVENALKPVDIKNLKKLHGYQNAYRIKIGDYRIGLFIENDIVEFARIAHRKDIYRLFP
ncbi:MAG: type II toxin-antitoxin system RelE/ParE family toxin [Bacteroidia bacterium]|nr:type II toxin-antitoxin system RelE/ParE family toxin [Bacteroidia bacterium]